MLLWWETNMGVALLPALRLPSPRLGCFLHGGRLPAGGLSASPSIGDSTFWEMFMLIIPQVVLGVMPKMAQSTERGPTIVE